MQSNITMMFKHSFVKLGLLSFSLLFLISCSSISVPKGVNIVDDFKVERYLGTWYEIARLPNKFEEGMSKVTATYSLRSDGGLAVLNKGYIDSENKWDSAEGKAYFVGADDKARLKVSFFGPFYGGYNVFYLDKISYNYSLVAGPDHSYLWILARRPQLDEAVKKELIAVAKTSGFRVEDLIWVRH